MQSLYDRVKTPYKYGPVLLPDEGEMLDNPMVFRHGGEWLMMYIRFDGAGYETHLARSGDLMEWEKLGCIFKRGEKGAWDGAQADGWPTLVDIEFDGINGLRKFDGRYWMMYLGGSAEGYETDPLSTGVAWTTNETLRSGWTRWDENPVMGPDDADAREFEKKTIYKHFTVEDPERRLGGRFVNFYNSKQLGEWVERIGMAVSDDLLHWRRYGGGPVVANEGALDHGIIGDPMIRKIGDVYVMFYFGYNWEGKGGCAFDTFAASRDLKNWTRWDGKLVEPSEPWDRDHAHKPWVVNDGGTVYHFYCAVGDKGRIIALATSRPVGKKKKDAAE